MSVWTTQETSSYIVDGTGDKLNNVWSTPEERAFDVMFLFLLETITFACTRKPFHIVQALYMLLSNFNPSHNQHLPKVLKCFVLIWLTNSTTGHYQCPITWLYTGKIVFYSQVCSFPPLSFALEQLVKQQVKLKGTRACLLGIFVYLPCRTVWGTT